MAVNSTSEGRSLVGAPTVNIADTADEVAYRLRVVGDEFDRLQLTAGAVLVGNGTAEPVAPGGGGGGGLVLQVRAVLGADGGNVLAEAIDTILLTALGEADLRAQALVTAAAADTIQTSAPAIFCTAPATLIAFSLSFQQVASAAGVLVVGTNIVMGPVESLPLAFALVAPGVYSATVTFEDADNADYNITGGVVTLKGTGVWQYNASVDVTTP